MHVEREVVNQLSYGYNSTDCMNMYRKKNCLECGVEFWYYSPLSKYCEEHRDKKHHFKALGKRVKKAGVLPLYSRY